MAKKVVTFGEIMLRLAPEGYYRFVQAGTYGATYGGGEANVAVSLANYGMDASFVTKLPAHEIGQAGVNALRQYGVDTSDIVRGGDRVGIYFLEKGASQSGSHDCCGVSGSGHDPSLEDEPAFTGTGGSQIFRNQRQKASSRRDPDRDDHDCGHRVRLRHHRMDRAGDSPYCATSDRK